MVIGLNRYFDLLGENQFYGNVSSRNIRRVREFVIGDYVVLDHWLGRIENIMEYVRTLTTQVIHRMIEMMIFLLIIQVCAY